MLSSDKPIKHPIAVFALVSTAQKLALLCDGEAVRDDTIGAIEDHLRPKMQAVVKAADGAAEALINALDELARGYIETRPLLEPKGT
jgi:hypothetical protein